MGTRKHEKPLPRPPPSSLNYNDSGPVLVCHQLSPDFTAEIDDPWEKERRSD